MPVYSNKMMASLQSSLMGMMGIILDRSGINIRKEDFVSAFIEEQHVEKLREVFDMIGGNKQLVRSVQVKIDVLDPGILVKPMVHFNGGVGLLVPEYVKHGFAQSCKPDIRATLVEWAENRARIQSAHEITNSALEWLNLNCRSALEITAILPCFPAIMANIDSRPEAKTSRSAEKLASSKPAPSIPRIPRATKEQILEASALMSSFALLKGAPIMGLPVGMAGLRPSIHDTVVAENRLFDF